MYCQCLQTATQARLRKAKLRILGLLQLRWAELAAPGVKKKLSSLEVAGRAGPALEQPRRRARGGEGPVPFRRFGLVTIMASVAAHPALRNRPGVVFEHYKDKLPFLRCDQSYEYALVCHRRTTLAVCDQAGPRAIRSNGARARAVALVRLVLVIGLLYKLARLHSH